MKRWKTLVGIAVCMLIPFAVKAQSKIMLEGQYMANTSKYAVTRAGILVNGGRQINDYFYVGAGSGRGITFRGNYIFLPLYATGRVYMVQTNVKPYFECRLGVDFPVCINNNFGSEYGGFKTGVFGEPSLGVKFQKMVAAVGVYLKSEGRNTATWHPALWRSSKGCTASVTIRLGYEF